MKGNSIYGRWSMAACLLFVIDGCAAKIPGHPNPPAPIGPTAPIGPATGLMVPPIVFDDTPNMTALYRDSAGPSTSVSRVASAVAPATVVMVPPIIFDDVQRTTNTHSPVAPALASNANGLSASSSQQAPVVGFGGNFSLPERVEPAGSNQSSTVLEKNASVTKSVAIAAPASDSTLQLGFTKLSFSDGDRSVSGTVFNVYCASNFKDVPLRSTAIVDNSVETIDFGKIKLIAPEDLTQSGMDPRIQVDPNFVRKLTTFCES